MIKKDEKQQIMQTKPIHIQRQTETLGEINDNIRIRLSLKKPTRLINLQKI